MSEQNKIDEIKARLAEKRLQRRHMKWSMDDEILNDSDWMIRQIERKDEALRFYADKKNWKEDALMAAIKAIDDQL
ncbi:hypothetical protein [Paenibacillus lautus]|uniref:Uncharacterized protein n=1 Tax=Paenibacillus lautus TaxID=1401 RepID=A0A385TW14_PAELA|nr:hypothetical protein [Paenibacillus lautus]AYB47148.1 hypothetical protein D5F53_29320 [Paenibacillus lautus]